MRPAKQLAALVVVDELRWDLDELRAARRRENRGMGGDRRSARLMTRATSCAA
jgi:hypothetical protein